MAPGKGSARIRVGGRGLIPHIPIGVSIIYFRAAITYYLALSQVNPIQSDSADPHAALFWCSAYRHNKPHTPHAACGRSRVARCACAEHRRLRFWFSANLARCLSPVAYVARPFPPVARSPVADVARPFPLVARVSTRSRSIISVWYIHRAITCRSVQRCRR